MSKRKLLAIDWPPSFAQQVRLAAAESELEVRVAGDPHEFMALYPNYQPDIVAFQVFMMEVDGIELIKWLGGQERKPCVLLSGGHAPRYAEAARVIAALVAEVEVRVVPNPQDETALRTSLAGLLRSEGCNGCAPGPIHE